MKKLFLFCCLAWAFESLCAQSNPPIPILNSYPEGKDLVIFLDFDGHYNSVSSRWSGFHSNQAWYAEPSGYTADQVQTAFDIVAEDYRPFQVNVTTDSLVYEQAVFNRKIRVVITPTASWYSNFNGGVAFLNSMAFGDDTPVWAFSSNLGNPKWVGDVCSHEAGHALNLPHHGGYDQNCVNTYTYEYGIGTGETSWAPIMGATYNVEIGSWDYGLLRCSNSIVDDIARIQASGFLLRADDIGNSFETARASFFEMAGDSIELEENGIITSGNDGDVFKITLDDPAFLHIVSSHAGGPGVGNLDLNLRIGQEGKPEKIYAPLSTISVMIDTLLQPGDYYFTISGDAHENFPNYGTTLANYGSLGAYQLAIAGKLAQISVDLGQDTIVKCAGSPWTLDAENAGTTYLWNTGATTRTIAVNAEGWYGVTVKRAGLQASDSVYVSATDSIVPVFAYNYPDQCGPVRVAFEDESESPCNQSVVKREWNFGDGSPVLSNTTGKLTHEFVEAGRYDVSLKLFSADGAAHEYKRSVNVVMVNPPSISLGENIQICKGQNVSLSPLFREGGRVGEDEYTWSTGSHNSSIVVGTAGTYSVRLQSGADSQHCSTTDTITVSYSTRLTATAGVVNDGLFGYRFAGNASSCDPASPPAHWHWDFGDGTSADTRTASHRYHMPGDYVVELSVSNDQSLQSVRDTVSVNFIYPLKKFDQRLYFPLADRTISVRFFRVQIRDAIELDADAQGEYELLNTLGQSLGSGVIQKGHNQILAGRVEKGVFFFRITSGKGMNVYRLIKL